MSKVFIIKTPDTIQHVVSSENEVEIFKAGFASALSCVEIISFRETQIDRVFEKITIEEREV